MSLPFGANLASLRLIVGYKRSEIAGDELSEPTRQARYANIRRSVRKTVSKHKSPLESATSGPQMILPFGPKLASLRLILGSKPSEIAGDELLEPTSQAKESPGEVFEEVSQKSKRCHP